MPSKTRHPDFYDKIVLITGGTRGIGLETALAFGSLGARCILTYRWGDHDENGIIKLFQSRGATAPIIIQADVGQQTDTIQLMQTLKKTIQKIDIFISNVSSAQIIKSFNDYSLKSLNQSISYSSWPLVSYTLAIKETFNQYPAYIVAVSSTGPDHYSYGYDFVSASKAVLETLCKYLNYRLRKYGVVINAVRSRAIRTQSLTDTFGIGLEDFMKKLVPDNYWLDPEEVAKSIIGLCSGFCDAISGQIITVDRGTSFFDNVMDIYTRFSKSQQPINLES